MAIRRVGGAAGPHTLEGPGYYNGARVAVSTLVGPVTILQGATKLGAFAAGAAVGSGPSSGSSGQVFSGPGGPHVQVTFASASDWLDVDFAGPYG